MLPRYQLDGYLVYLDVTIYPVFVLKYTLVYRSFQDVKCNIQRLTF